MCNTQALSNLKVNMTIKTFLTQNKSANLWIFALVNSTFNTSENIKTQKNIFKAPLNRQRNKKILWKELLEDNQMVFKNTLCMQQHHSHCRFCLCDSDLASTVDLSSLHMNVSLLLQWCLLKFIHSWQRTFQSALEECGFFHLKPIHICYAAVWGKNSKCKCISHVLSSQWKKFGASRTLPSVGQLTKLSNRGEHMFIDVTATQRSSSHPGLRPRVRGWKVRFSALIQLRLTFVALVLSIRTNLIKLERLCREGTQRIPKSRFEQTCWNVDAV